MQHSALGAEAPLFSTWLEALSAAHPFEPPSREVALDGRSGRLSGYTLDGFRLGELIGRGGSGEVYAAEHLPSATSLAIKLLRLDALGDQEVVARFKREARIMAAICSPHVVQVRSVNVDGAVFPYIAMERLHGVDLASCLRAHGKLALHEVVHMVEELSLGLEAAHQAQVVHRDLKPSNVFRAQGPDGAACWKLLDFGISKLLGAHADPCVTFTGLLGTPQFMAPEQVVGERCLDHRTDLYALSAITYCALTGEPPFSGAVPSVLRSVAECMPTAPSVRVAVHHDVELALAIGLAKHPEQRFGSAHEFAQAFRQAVRGELSPALRSHARSLLIARPYAP